MGDMDSGNSASIQSSSTAGGGAGDDQEFESNGGGGGGVFRQEFDDTASFQLYNFDTNFMINQNHNHNHNSEGTNNNDLGLMWPSSISSPLANTNCTTTTMGPATGLGPNNNNNNQQVGIGPRSIPSSGGGPGGAGRNPKKRSRASRRAPTTVLTTDTNNFRQMVQEFTGIPASPFSGRTRLDLLGGAGIHQTPPYLLRPFPQKIVPSNTNNHLSINSSLNSQNSINNPTNNNSILTLQSLLRPPSSSGVENLYRPDIGLINQFALGRVTATTTTTSNVIMEALNQDRLPLRRKVGNGFVDDGGSSSRNAGTSLENHGSVSVTRGEGMVDSWICSSD
ncbi:hypothetical protein KSS87_011922 [Heliosperma pusillum]|nr:hypothetical protein KSS87_011922 [Heliosperma pusillum]